MSWNEPGAGNNDPWGSSGGSQNTPPDLEEIVKKVQDKLIRHLGGRGSEPAKNGKLISVVFFIVSFLWILMGFYIVDAGSQGVVTRFGRYTETTAAGLHWRWPFPIEDVEVVNVGQQRFIEIGYKSGARSQALGSVPKEALMLTQDENIVDIRLAIQYQIKDARQYIFDVADPEATLKQVTESAERGVIGKNSMDFVLTEGRSGIADEIKNEIQQVLDSYNAGIRVVTVNFVDAQPPEEVQNAFEDAIKAREDEQRLINEAEAYANEVIPAARGGAARLIEEAEGYKQRVVARAHGESGRFIELLKEYEKSPETMRERLYLDALEGIYEKSNTVIVDTAKSGNSLVLYMEKPGFDQRVLGGTKESASVISAIDPSDVPIKSSRLGVGRGRDSRAP